MTQCHATVPHHTPTSFISIYMDVGLDGWGAHIGPFTVQGLLSPKRWKLHLYLQELKAVHLALQALLLNFLNYRVIHVVSDNSTVVRYINKQGGMTPVSVLVQNNEHYNSSETHRRNSKCHSRHSVKKKSSSSHTEWILDQTLFQMICQMKFMSMIDLFATRYNH